MSKIPKVSIIVPVYNAEPYLTHCLDSITKQTFHDIEIICVDDKSTDNSLEMLYKYAEIDSRINIKALKKNSGVSAARNAGIDAARGKYIAFVDADDTVDLDFCDTLCKALEQSHADIAKAALKIIDINGKIRTNDNYNLRIKNNGKWEFDWQFYTALYNRDIIEKNNIRFDTSLTIGEDIVFLCDYIKNINSVVVCPSVSYNYIKRAGSAYSAMFLPDKILSELTANTTVCETMLNSGEDSNKYINSYIRRTIATAFVHTRNTTEHCHKMVADALITLYKKCPNKSALINGLRSENAQIIKYLQSYDADGIVKSWDWHQNRTKHSKIKRHKTFLLFHFIPVIKTNISDNSLTIKLFQLQLLRIKRSKNLFRIYVLYIPIIRIKSK